MKHINIYSLLKFLLISFSLSILIIGCDKEDNQGKLVMEFSITPSQVYIYTTANENTPILTLKMKDAERYLTVSLNPGNYIVEPYKLGYIFEKRGVQIQGRENTHLIFENTGTL